MNREHDLARKAARYVANKDQINAERRARYASDSKHREEVLSRNTQYRDVNREQINADARERYINDPDYREERLSSRRERYWRDPESERTRVKEYTAENADRVKAYKEAYREEHREELSQKQLDYYYANHEEIRERTNERNRTPEMREKLRPSKRYHAQIRRARKLNQMGTVSSDIEARLYEQQSGRCAGPGCGEALDEVEVHLDHVIPIARGGLHDDGNLQLLCAWCNQSKGPKLPHEFAQRRGMLV